MPSGIYKRTKEHVKNMTIALNKPEVIEKNRQRAIKMWQDGAFDEDVKKRSERMKGNQYSKGHKHTEETKKKMSIANSGENSASYKDGRTLKKYYCIDCGKELTGYTHKRCGSCDGKRKWQNPEYKEKNKTRLGRKHTEETKNKMRNALDRHHIYLDADDDKTLLLTSSKHRQLHARAYTYLVKISKIDDYIKWFGKEYGLFKREEK
jgi:hypothetical protein